MRHLIPLALAIALAACLTTPETRAGESSIAGDREADHQQLRSLLVEMTTALNSADIAKLEGCLASKFDITFADQSHLTDVTALKAYDARIRQEKRVNAMVFAPVADAPTRFLGADAGVCTGTSTDTFTGDDGSTFILTSRWTATVVREQGAWKLSAVHAGVNLLDNPVLAAVTSMIPKIAIASAAVAILSLVIGYLVGRRRRAA
ncbi:MAG: hypothetical protein H0V44_09655 [Planctomycetes bacterium]|nr:hypothetical protein [Planctomycetota bacterium]